MRNQIAQDSLHVNCASHQHPTLTPCRSHLLIDRATLSSLNDYRFQTIPLRIVHGAHFEGRCFKDRQFSSGDLNWAIDWSLPEEDYERLVQCIMYQKYLPIEQ